MLIFSRSSSKSLHQRAVVCSTRRSFLYEVFEINETFLAFDSKLYPELNEYDPIVHNSCSKYPVWFNSAIIISVGRKIIFSKKFNPSPLVLEKFRRLKTYKSACLLMTLLKKTQIASGSPRYIRSNSSLFVQLLSQNLVTLHNQW